jgi:hypothetical protein
MMSDVMASCSRSNATVVMQDDIAQVSEGNKSVLDPAWIAWIGFYAMHQLHPVGPGVAIPHEDSHSTNSSRKKCHHVAQ